EHQRIVRLRGSRSPHLFPRGSFVAARSLVVRHAQMRLGEIRIEIESALRGCAHVLASDFERSYSCCDADPMHAGEPRPGRGKLGIDSDRLLVGIPGTLEVERASALEEEARSEQVLVNARILQRRRLLVRTQRNLQ